MTIKKFGVDISKYNGNVDMRLAKSNGVDFVILKAGSGARGEDPYFQRNYTNAKATGMPVGAYWYSYAMNVREAKGEAIRFLKLLEGKQFEYPVYLDFEDPTQRNISKATKTDMAIAFMSILEKNGYYTGLYSSGDWINNKFDRDRLKNYDIWIAHWYVNSARCYRSYGMWQFTNKQKVPGVPSTSEGGVDANYAFVDYPKIIKAAGLNGYKKEKTEVKGLTKMEEEKLLDQIKHTVVTYESKDYDLALKIAKQHKAILVPAELNLDFGKMKKSKDTIIGIGSSTGKIPGKNYGITGYCDYLVSSDKVDEFLKERSKFLVRK
jgi:GH25 family lysozyme M1 (1,4-beta-N-acetylmuramidase)